MSIETDYPGLEQMTKDVVGVLKEHCLPYKTTFDQDVPPLLLCDDNELKKIVAQVSAASSREGNKDRTLSSYSVKEHVIYFERDSAKRMLRGSVHERMELAHVLAEEYLHGISAVDTPSGVRVGYLHTPVLRSKTPVTAESIQEYEFPTAVPNPDSRRLFTEDPLEIRLTENVTMLALHLILEQLLREFHFVPHQLLAFFGSNEPAIIIQKNWISAANTFSSLLSGNIEQLRDLIVPKVGRPLAEHTKMQDRVAGVLSSPGLQIASLKNFPPAPTDIYGW